MRKKSLGKVRGVWVQLDHYSTQDKREIVKFVLGMVGLFAMLIFMAVVAGVMQS
jgi:hypothetical protein